MNVAVEGMDEVKRQFSALMDKMQRATLRGALKQAAKPVVKAAKARVDVLTGKLKRSIRSKVSVRSATSFRAGSKAEVSIGFGRKQFYGIAVELGHVIKRSRRGPVLGHVPARPFLRPALDTQQGAAVAAFAGALNGEIQKVTARARKR